MTNLNNDFANMVSALSIFSSIEQPQLNKKNSKNYLYLNVENNALHIESSAKAKRLDLEQLATKIEDIMQEAESASLFLFNQSSDLDNLIKGMEVLKNRIQTHTHKMDPLKRFILSLFGYMDTYDRALEKIDHAIHISKKQILPLKIKRLTHENRKIEAEIKIFHEQIKNFPSAEDDSKALDTVHQKELELRQEYEKLISKKNPLLDKQLKVSSDQKKSELTTLSSQIKEIEKKKTLVAIFKKDTPKLKELKSKQTILKNQLEEFKKIKIEYLKVEEKIKKLEEKITDINVEKEKIKVQQQLRIDLNEKIKEKKTLQDQNNQEISKSQDELNRLLARVPKNVELETKKVDVSINESLETNLIGHPYFLKAIRQRLGWENNDKDTEAYLDFQRVLIFGFSIGQAHTLKTICKKTNLNLIDLHNILEGSSTSINMLYLSNYLSELINSTNPDQIEFLEKIKQVKALLDRSLPTALEKHAIAVSSDYQASLRKNINPFKKTTEQIIENLNDLKNDEVFLLPIGTSTHDTILQLKKLKDGKIQSTIYNTGEGLEAHLTPGMNLQAAKEFFSLLDDRFPITQTFPAFDLSSDPKKIETLINDLFKIKSTAKGNTKQMYECLTQSLGKGKAGSPKPIQISGVCSFQALDEVFKDLLGSKIYQQYRKGLLTSIQKEFQKNTEEIRKLAVKDSATQMVLELHDSLLKDNEEEIIKIKL